MMRVRRAREPYHFLTIRSANPRSRHSLTVPSRMEAADQYPDVLPPLRRNVA